MRHFSQADPAGYSPLKHEQVANAIAPAKERKQKTVPKFILVEVSQSLLNLMLDIYLAMYKEEILFF